MDKMKVAIGCDHGGYSLKQIVMKFLTDKGYEMTDFGTYTTESCDYPIYAEKVATAVAEGQCELGILICGTGIGMSLAANKVNGIRAAVVGDYFSAKYTRMHNNANILCMGERVTGPGAACEMAELFLTTEFEGGRHERRVNMITEIENKNRAKA